MIPSAQHPAADLTEHIKWNAPSYVLDGEDRITLNLLNKQGLAKLVLHMVATRPENRRGCLSSDRAARNISLMLSNPVVARVI
jgi:hypothetical protein